ncbi:MAG TPA: polynucleotide kinase-phosphatase [Chitinophagales bacterium]|nr:polynucleotide kinase-phosphatase [Chitinophagales bacterium]
MELRIPELSLVLLIGASGAGKSSFARRVFKPTEVVSSDYCRALISDDENNMETTDEAFELAEYIVRKRLKNGMLTVLDATNVQPAYRKRWVQMAREYHALPVAIVLDMPEKLCIERTRQRTDRNLSARVINTHVRQLHQSMRKLKEEGFRHIHTLRTEEEVNNITGVQRDALYNNKKHVTGPFDIIGDIHGCYEELCLLLDQLGYSVEKTDTGYGVQVTPPVGRTAVFLGDLVDRGPDSPSVLRLVMSMVKAGNAWCVPGNHDAKLLKYLLGKNVQLKHGLEKTVEQIKNEPADFIEDLKNFLDKLVSHYVFDGGRLVVAHAGLKEEMQGRGSGAVRSFCMYGETTGETDEFGLPVRYNWALEYKGKAMVVYGHTPVPEPDWLNRTIDIDTGCVFGGKLTALRYPERELVDVPALQQYCVPSKPLFIEPVRKETAEGGNAIDIEDVTGKQVIHTRYAGNVVIRAEQTAPALELMSRFSINPEWLIYLPPTMSPAETSPLHGILEHPAEAFAYYTKQGVTQVVCEEKHMGSRAVVIVCKDETVARKKFGSTTRGLGVCYTRTGRSYFNNEAIEAAFIERVNIALTNTDFWNRFETNWVCLDAELMPWSDKALSLIKDQYASVGTAALHTLEETLSVMQKASANLPQLNPMVERYTTRSKMVQDYTAAYRQYCREVNSLDDYKLAPFHILATEGKTYFDKSHEWHMQQIATICAADEKMLLATPYRVVDLNSNGQMEDAIAWWNNLTANGGEGIVVKPYQFVVKGKAGLVQPAIKIRGREYLRIIYGPEYTAPENMERLKKRGVSAKRTLAAKEFALGAEALEKFVANEPLRTVHQCVFAILALETEAIDPRL